MKTILVALDNSPRAPEVLKAAIAAANAAPDAKLVLFRAVGIPPEMPGLIWQTDAPSLMDLLRDAAKKDLEAHAAKCRRTSAPSTWSRSRSAALPERGAHRPYRTLPLHQRNTGGPAAALPDPCRRVVGCVRGDHRFR